MMNRFLAGPMVLAFCLLIPLPTYAQDTPTPEKKALIKELLRLINATGNSEAMTNQMLDKMREPFVMLVSQGLLKEIPQQKLSPAEQRRLKSEAEESAQHILARVRIEIPKRVNIVVGRATHRRENETND